MITKSDVLDELILWLEEKKQEVLDLADQEAHPLQEAVNNPQSEDHEYANKEFDGIMTHMNDVVTFIDELTLVLEHEPTGGLKKWKA